MYERMILADADSSSLKILPCAREKEERMFRNLTADIKDKAMAKTLTIRLRRDWNKNKTTLNDIFYIGKSISNEGFKELGVCRTVIRAFLGQKILHIT